MNNDNRETSLECRVAKLEEKVKEARIIQIFFAFCIAALVALAWYLNNCHLDQNGHIREIKAILKKVEIK